MCREKWTWPGLAALRVIHPRFFRVDSMAPGAQSAFQFLRCIPSDSGKFRLLFFFFSLYVSLVVKEAWKLDGTIGHRY